jgi:hypothetical protein
MRPEAAANTVQVRRDNKEVDFTSRLLSWLGAIIDVGKVTGRLFTVNGANG